MQPRAAMSSELGAELVWKVRGMGTVVVCLRVSQAGPAILLSGHLEGATPILVYRVADYADSIDRLRSAGVKRHARARAPPGPCASFGLPDGQRVAIYELTRPFVLETFAGRLDD